MREQHLHAPQGVLIGRIILFGVVIVVIAPLIPLFLYSISGGWLYPDILPAHWSARAWRYVADPRSRVLEAFANSSLIAVAVTLTCIALGVPAGRGLAALPPGLRALLEFLFFAPVIVPALTVSLGLHVVFVRIGIANVAGGVVLAHLLPTLPYMVLIMTSTFSNRDQELEQQARTLGAGPVRAFLIVGLPSAVPGVLTGGLFVFLISWSQYALTLLVGGGRVITLPVLLFAFAASGDLALTAALSIVFVVPAVVILAVTAQFLTGRSIALTGVAR